MEMSLKKWIHNGVEKYGIRITGLLGILMDAKELGMIDEVKPIMDRLIYEVGFRIRGRNYCKR